MPTLAATLWRKNRHGPLVRIGELRLKEVRALSPRPSANLVPGLNSSLLTPDLLLVAVGRSLSSDAHPSTVELENKPYAPSSNGTPWLAAKGG